MARSPDSAPLAALSRRERQIMDILFRLEHATAAEVRENLPDPPSYSAVRSHLRILEEKGHATHRRDRQRYVFSPTVPREKAARSALHGVLENFFGNSREQVVATLLDLDTKDLSDEELDRLAELIDRAREEGR